MATTPNLGLHVYGGDIPGSITDNGSQHTAADRYFLDQVITQLANSSRHYLPPVATVPVSFSLDTDAGTGQLQDGVTYFYRVALVDRAGFERIASDEASVAMPDVLDAPAAPGLRDASGGSLTPGLYYYALTAKSDSQESTLGAAATVNVFPGTNQAINVDAPADAQGVPLQVWRKKDTDPGYTRLGVIAAGGTFTDDGSTPANPYSLNPAYAPPASNRGKANNSVTITLVADAAEAADNGSIASWRIYRSTISGYYSAQSLVHDVVETDDEDGNGEGTLRTSWVDTGDALRVGQPQFKDRSLPLTPYAPQTVTALPTDVAAYPANYLLVFNDDLYILKDGSWQLVGGGTKVTTGTALPATTGRSQGDWHVVTKTGRADAAAWYTLTGTTWTLVTEYDLSTLPTGDGGSPVLTSPSGNRFRTVVADDGTLSSVQTLEPGPPAPVAGAHLEEIDGRPSQPVISAYQVEDGILVSLLSGGDDATSYTVLVDLGLGPTELTTTTFPFQTGIKPNGSQQPNTTVTVTATNAVGTSSSAATSISADPTLLPTAPVIAATRSSHEGHDYLRVTATTPGSNYSSGLGTEPGGLYIWADGDFRVGGGGIDLPYSVTVNWGGNVPCDIYVVVKNRYGSAKSNTVSA